MQFSCWDCRTCCCCCAASCCCYATCCKVLCNALVSAWSSPSAGAASAEVKGGAFGRGPKLTLMGTGLRSDGLPYGGGPTVVLYGTAVPGNRLQLGAVLRCRWKEVAGMIGCYVSGCKRGGCCGWLPCSGSCQEAARVRAGVGGQAVCCAPAAGVICSVQYWRCRLWYLAVETVP